MDTDFEFWARDLQTLMSCINGVKETIPNYKMLTRRWDEGGVDGERDEYLDELKYLINELTKISKTAELHYTQYKQAADYVGFPSHNKHDGC